MIIAKFGLDSRKKNIGIKIRHPSRLRVKRRGVRRDSQSRVEDSEQPEMAASLLDI
jgi:hypothetical protein